MPPPFAERTKAWLAFICFFFLITGYYWIKAVRDAVFVHRVGVESLPLTRLWVVIGSLAAVCAYGWVARRVSSRRLILGCFGGFAVWLSWCWGPLARKVGWAPHVFYVGLDVAIPLLVSLFWSLANESFGVEEGRRRYGPIAAAGPLGALCGAWGTHALAGRVGSVNLLGIALPCFLIALAAALALDAAARRWPPMDPARISVEHGGWDLRVLFRSRYVLLIAGVMAAMVFVTRIYDYDFKRLLRRAVPGEDAMTAWEADRQRWENGLGIAVQALVTPFVLRRYGPGGALWIMPALAGVGGLTLAAAETLPVAFGLMVGAGAVGYTLNQSARELLYVPCDRAIKYQAKAAVNLFCFRAGDAAAAFFLYAGRDLLGRSYQPFLVLAAGVCVAWLGFSLRLGARFREVTGTRP